MGPTQIHVGMSFKKIGMHKAKAMHGSLIGINSYMGKGWKKPVHVGLELELALFLAVICIFSINRVSYSQIFFRIPIILKSGQRFSRFKNKLISYIHKCLSSRIYEFKTLSLRLLFESALPQWFGSP